jgi:hypothetical protein
MDDLEAQSRTGAGTPVGHAGGHPSSIWAAGAPEIRYVKSEDVRRVPGCTVGCFRWTFARCCKAFRLPR